VNREQVLKTCDTGVVDVVGPNMPILQVAEPVGQTVIELMNLLWRRGFDLSSMNEGTATATKQPGITANSALLTLADIQTELFSIIWRSYQQIFVELARQDIYAVHELQENGAELTARWLGGQFLREIGADALNIEDSQYQIAIQPAPSSKGTAAGRLQSAENLYQAGGLTLDALVAVRQYFDSPREFDRISRQREMLDRVIERWLDADDDQLISGMFDPIKAIPLVPPPLKWMRLEDAIVQVADAYMEAELDDAPDEIKQLFLDWLPMAEQALQQKQQAAAAAMQPPQQMQPQAGGVPQQNAPTQPQAPMGLVA